MKIFLDFICEEAELVLSLLVITYGGLLVLFVGKWISFCSTSHCQKCGRALQVLFGDRKDLFYCQYCSGHYAYFKIASPVKHCDQPSKPMFDEVFVWILKLLVTSYTLICLFPELNKYVYPNQEIQSIFVYVPSLVSYCKYWIGVILHLVLWKTSYSRRLWKNVQISCWMVFVMIDCLTINLRILQIVCSVKILYTLHTTSYTFGYKSIEKEDLYKEFKSSVLCSLLNWFSKLWIATATILTMFKALYPEFNKLFNLSRKVRPFNECVQSTACQSIVSIVSLNYLNFWFGAILHLVLWMTSDLSKCWENVNQILSWIILIVIDCMEITSISPVYLRSLQVCSCITVLYTLYFRSSKSPKKENFKRPSLQSHSFDKHDKFSMAWKVLTKHRYFIRIVKCLKEEDHFPLCKSILSVLCVRYLNFWIGGLLQLFFCMKSNNPMNWKNNNQILFWISMAYVSKADSRTMQVIWCMMMLPTLYLDALSLGHIFKKVLSTGQVFKLEKKLNQLNLNGCTSKNTCQINQPNPFQWKHSNINKNSWIFEEKKPGFEPTTKQDYENHYGDLSFSKTEPNKLTKRKVSFSLTSTESLVFGQSFEHNHDLIFYNNYSQILAKDQYHNSTPHLTQKIWDGCENDTGFCSDFEDTPMYRKYNSLSLF